MKLSNSLFYSTESRRPPVIPFPKVLFTLWYIVVPPSLFYFYCTIISKCNYNNTGGEKHNTISIGFDLKYVRPTGIWTVQL